MTSKKKSQNVDGALVWVSDTLKFNTIKRAPKPKIRGRLPSFGRKNKLKETAETLSKTQEVLKDKTDPKNNQKLKKNIISCRKKVKKTKKDQELDNLLHETQLVPPVQLPKDHHTPNVRTTEEEPKSKLKQKTTNSDKKIKSKGNIKIPKLHIPSPSQKEIRNTCVSTRDLTISTLNDDSLSLYSTYTDVTSDFSINYASFSDGGEDLAEFPTEDDVDLHDTLTGE